MKQKTAFVTGASRGIGAESAVALARSGYDVVITARTLVEGEPHDRVGKVIALPGSLEATACAIRREGQKVLALKADILDEAMMLDAASQALADQGGWGFAYPASKAALARMAGSLRVEHPNTGLRCYNLEPGTVFTEVMRVAGITEELLKRYKAVSPAAIAGVVAWLADNEPSAQWLSEDTLRGPAIAKQLGLLDCASFLENPDE